MAPPALPLFLLGLLCACSWIFAAASPILLVSNADKSPERNASSSGSLLTRQAGVPLYERCKQAGHLAMTFDDGPYFGGQTATLLEEYGGKGTYFVNGNNWDCIYSQRRANDLIKRYKAGHVIGVHGWSHSDITTLTSEELHYQLDLIEAAFRKILGVKPRFFRPPYGTYDNRSLKILQDRGYSVVLWDFDAEDTTGATPDESIASYEDLLETFPTPHIALNHEATSLFTWGNALVSSPTKQLERQVAATLRGPAMGRQLELARRDRPS
ncbi:Carbohydrate esterase 4 protein [Rhodotorula mucilaginosa]|uniref:Carbohydrate esterase 4 protein n=1 Tax=Rhodotorula mucilaginosa TaxID=5537 RepID=A0A9P7BA04_RHOMI|nr:Carbohydrate esterase 4 protein [Rhodotorula mucilaginosa]